MYGFLFQMKNTTFFIDMHGVLVNSSKMIKNYEKVLINIFKKYNISEEEAIEYHNQGLKLYSKLLNEIKEKKLQEKQFLNAMDVADKQWDILLQGFVKGMRALELESRNIEFLAGSYANAFYDDAKTFMNKIVELSNYEYDINFFIVSNSHSKHIEGLFTGAGFIDFDKSKLYGWDNVKSLKNDPYYYKKLIKLSKSKNNIILGNSKEEMLFGKKAGMKTVFVERELKGPIDFDEYIDLRIKNLENILSLVQEII